MIKSVVTVESIRSAEDSDSVHCIQHPWVGELGGDLSKASACCTELGPICFPLLRKKPNKAKIRKQPGINLISLHYDEAHQGRGRRFHPLLMWRELQFESMTTTQLHRYCHIQAGCCTQHHWQRSNHSYSSSPFLSCLL